MHRYMCQWTSAVALKIAAVDESVCEKIITLSSTILDSGPGREYIVARDPQQMQ